MGLWSHIGEVVATAGRITGLSSLIDGVRAVAASVGALGRPITFTVAIIALSAKMAKADGVVSIDEFEMFRRLVQVPPAEEANVQYLFEVAQKDVAGFETYARRLAELAEGDQTLLADIIEALFHIAAADGFVHAQELAYLERVAEVFELDQRLFDRVAAGFLRRDDIDPYRVLGIAPTASDADVKAAWRTLVKETHPDRHHAHGLPEEFHALLTARLQAINAAFEQIRLERGLT